jgi:hypothetical protein
VVMVPDGIPRHMGDAEILHEQDPTPSAQLPGPREARFADLRRARLRRSARGSGISPDIGPH